MTFPSAVGATNSRLASKRRPPAAQPLAQVAVEGLVAEVMSGNIPCLLSPPLPLLPQPPPSLSLIVYFQTHLLTPTGVQIPGSSGVLPGVSGELDGQPESGWEPGGGVLLHPPECVSSVSGYSRGLPTRGTWQPVRPGRIRSYLVTLLFSLQCCPCCFSCVVLPLFT